MDNTTDQQRVLPAADLFGGMWMGATLAQCCLWIALTLSSVHEKMQPRDGTEEYGWPVVWVMTCLVVSLTVTAYKWGVASRRLPNDKLRDGAPETPLAN